MSEQSSGLTSNRKGDSAPIPQDPTGAATLPAEKKGAGRRKLLLGAAGLLILAGALWFGIPWVQTTLNTVSTDDAYVNNHVTFVAARVRGQVARVLVDDNYRVHKGDLLVELDKQSRSNRRLSIRRRRTCKSPSPKCAAPKLRP